MKSEFKAASLLLPSSELRICPKGEPGKATVRGVLIWGHHRAVVGLPHRLTCKQQIQHRGWRRNFLSEFIRNMHDLP